MDTYFSYITEITDLKQDILKSLEFIKYKKIIKKDDVVFIKPNFTYPFYKEGVTTRPELLREFLKIMKNVADEVILGESDGGNHSYSANDAFHGHGMHEICKDTGVELVNLSKLPSKFIEEKIQGKRVKVQLPNLLLEQVDCVISIPVLKVHTMTNVSLSMKNLWGCYPDTMRCLNHKNFSHKITLITKLLNPKIILIDGIYALTDHGPMHGTAKKTNLIVSSNNPVVADSVGASIMGMPLKDINHIQVAEKEGLGTTNLIKVNMNQNWENYKMQFHVDKTLIDKLSVLTFNSEFLSRFVINSPFTSIIYRFATFLRNKEEQDVVNDLKKYY